MLCGWEDNLASGVSPATRYRLRGLWKGESTIPTGARNFCLGVQKFRVSGSPRDSDHLDKVTARLPQVPQVDFGEGGGLHDSDYGTLTFLIPYF